MYSAQENQAKCHLGNLVKLGYAVFEICEWTDRHTGTLVAV